MGVGVPDVRVVSFSGAPSCSYVYQGNTPRVAKSQLEKLPCRVNNPLCISEDGQTLNSLVLLISCSQYLYKVESESWLDHVLITCP